MDPLSITTAVVGLTATCVQTAKALNDIKGRFQNASLMISAICTETTIISASLSRIQSLMLGSPQELVDKLTGRPDLEATLDHILTGCWIIFDVLQNEIQKVSVSARDTGLIDLGLKAKLRYMWNESTMQEILTQLRGLQTALTLLLQLLGADTIASLKQIMENNTAVLSQVVQRTVRFQTARPSHTPQSIFDMSFATQSILHGDGNSVATSTLFSFDDEVVNSHIYRRVLAKAYSNSRDDNETAERTPQQHTEYAKVIQANRTRLAEAPSDERLLAFDADYSSSESDQDNDKTRNSKMANAISTSNGPALSATPSDPVITFISSNSTQNQDWATTFNLKVAEIENIPQQEVLRQTVIHELIVTESQYLESLRILLYFYKYRLYLDPSIPTKMFSKEQFPGCEDIYHANKVLLHNPMVLRQNDEGPWISALWDLLQNWLTQSKEFYFQYASRYPTIAYLTGVERRNNVRFARFVEQTSSHPLVRRMSFDSYLRAPLIRIQRLQLILMTIMKHTTKSDASQQGDKLEQLISAMRSFVEDCGNVLEESSKEVEVIALFLRIATTDGRPSRSIPPPGSIIRFNELMIAKESRFGDSRELRVVVVEKQRLAVGAVTESYGPTRTFIFKETGKSGLAHESGLSLIVKFDAKPDIHYNLDNPTKDLSRRCRIELRSSPDVQDTISIVLYAATKEEIDRLVSAIAGSDAQSK